MVPNPPCSTTKPGHAHLRALATEAAGKLDVLGFCIMLDGDVLQMEKTYGW